MRHFLKLAAAALASALTLTACAPQPGTKDTPAQATPAENPASVRAGKALRLIEQSELAAAHKELLAAYDIDPGWILLTEDDYSGGKFALVDTDAFVSIARLTRAFETLDRELRPLRAEVKALKEKTDADPAGAERDALKKALEQKQQESSRRLDARLKELTGPVYQSIADELQLYCRERGISLVIDLARPLGATFAKADLTNVTADFVNHFNDKYPASPN